MKDLLLFIRKLEGDPIHKTSFFSDTGLAGGRSSLTQSDEVEGSLFFCLHSISSYVWLNEQRGISTFLDFEIDYLNPESM